MLYIIRHGKTDWNAEMRIQGRTDVPLNEEGRRSALEAGEKAKDCHFDVCYVSPLSRARETAELFLKGMGKEKEIPMIMDDRLVEMSFGCYEGVDGTMKLPESPIASLFLDPEHYVPGEGGETFEELMARTGNFLEEVIYPQLKEGKDILIVGHGAMNSSIVCQVNHAELKDFWALSIGNCQLHRLI